MMEAVIPSFCSGIREASKGGESGREPKRLVVLEFWEELAKTVEAGDEAARRIGSDADDMLVDA